MTHTIVPATSADKLEILSLYRSQLGRAFCPWNAHYPGMTEIEFDLRRNSLFVMKNEQRRIIAAVSIDRDENVDKLTCWTKDLLPGGEMSRLAVAVDRQNQGVAREMLSFGMAELKRRGFKSVHFLVNRNNEKALRSYAHLHFQVVGECELYDQPFLCFEKPL